MLVAAAPAHGEAELRERSGRHIRLVTDLRDAGEADTLVATFDAAVPQWMNFWGLDEAAADGSSSEQPWQVVAYVMRDPDHFRRLGLLPDRLPEFAYGYAAGNRLWVIAQPSEYYTRHLLLHEGVHAFAFEQFGGAGPTWFMEGTAELLATHRGSGRTTEIACIPDSREEVPYWGRFKLISGRREAETIPSIESVMRLPPTRSGDPEAYAWSWAATMLLHAYPEYREAFLSAARNGADTGSGFTRQLYRRLQTQWPVLVARWRLMCLELDYGFDWARQRVELSPSYPLYRGGRIVQQVRADRGWQSAGVRLAAGTRLKLTANGRCVVAETSEPWVSEPPGVTIRYHDGRPLGQLLACLVPCQSADRPTLPPLEVHDVGESAELTAAEPCWLLLRVNDAAGELGDNRGGYAVSIEPSR